MSAHPSLLRKAWQGFLFVTVHQWKLIDEDYRQERERNSSTTDVPDPQKPPGKSKRGKKPRNWQGKKRDENAASDIVAAPPKQGYEWHFVIILTIVAISLTLQEYYGGKRTFVEFFPRKEYGGEYWELSKYAWWSGWRVFGYIVIPAAAILAMRGERLRDYYITTKGFFKHLWIYVLLFVLILPFVIWMSTTKSFQHTYPFYKLANRSSFDFWAWEGMYAVQFLALEIFFRGFMLHGLGRHIGSKAIFVMAVPYCMIHYGKPLPETLGAIFAGIILGTLAMRTRSIWGGFAIHVGVALTMDLLAVEYLKPHR